MNLISTDSDNREPDDSGYRAKDAEQSREEAGRRSKTRIPDAAFCLAALANLAGAVAMGHIKPAQASAIRAAFAEILRHHQKIESRDDRKGIANDDVMEMMRKDPKVFSVLEPFLTDEQIDMVMHGGQDGNGEQA